MTAEGRPAPTSSGQLARTPLPHLLVYAHDRQLTGTFEFRAPDASHATVLILQGRPAKAKLSSQTIYLGQALLEIGAIDAATLDASLREMSAPGVRKLHGAILMERGSIDQLQLEHGLRAQLMQKLALVAHMPAATVFEFYSEWDGLAEFGAEPVPIEALSVVWLAVREQPPLEHVKAALERMMRGRLRIAKTAQLERFGFTNEERRWIDLLRVRAMRLDDFFGAAEQINERITRLIVYCLAITKQIDLMSEEEAAAAEAAAKEQQQIPPASSSAPVTPKAAVGRITLRRERQITNPSIVEEKSSPRIPSVPDQRASPPPDQAATAIAATPAPIEERRKEILARSQIIDKQNYFEMLAVTPESPIEDVKTAYIGLAKTWHPDRLPTVLADIKDQCARVFARMSEAHATLTDKEKRARYLTLMKEGGETPEQQEEIAAVIGATLEFQKAEICLKKNDLAQAEVLAKRAVQMDPNQADYIALLAWVESLKESSQTPEATQERIAELDRAIKINERCERAYYYRAMLYRRHNRDGLAFKDFQKVAQLNPKNIDAQRELRLYEMRGGAPQRAPSTAPPQAASAQKPGLFQKFFKK